MTREFERRKRANKYTTHSTVVCAAIDSLSQSNSFIERKIEEKRLLALEPNNMTEKMDLIDKQIDSFLKNKEKQDEDMRKTIFSAKPA